MKQLKLKIMMACAGILLGVIMLASASYAWLTVSVTPEIQRLVISVTPSGQEYPFELSIDYGEKLKANQADQATWTTELHLDDVVKNYTLQPISTVDGIHWYLPKYSADGNVKGFWEADLAKCANKANSSDNYLVYVDVWVRTRDKDPQEMLLSNPVSTTAGEEYYANYVLWNPKWDADTGQWLQNDAMTTVRIGFMYTPLDEKGNPAGSSSFSIYEPNGNMRSSRFAEYLATLKTDTSIDEEELDQLTGRIYSYTGGTNYTAKQYDETFTDQYYSTLAPKYVSDGVYELVDVTQLLKNNLIVQTKSSWNTARLSPSAKINSDAIGTIGNFCRVEVDESGKATGTLTPIDTNGRREMTTVTKGTIQKMRIYIWLEGQDIDCWNQTADGNIYANLEFLGRAAVQNNK